MVYLLRALYFRRVMREVLVDSEGEVEAAPFVHALIRVDRKSKVEDVVWVGELGVPCSARLKLFEI